ncbi:succinyl-CoA:coenzyme A transferase [Peptococcaceae bacterium CEB3]|nr:succinyl-CoA:coenzyme A transferase [Peptococcaceae bacterium CEB3]
MADVKELYQRKRMSAEEVIKLIQDGDYISIPVGVGEPPALLTALSDHRREYRDVKVMQILPIRKYGYYDPETVENVRHLGFFLGGPSRLGIGEGWVDVIPNYFYELPQLIREGAIPVDVVMAMASPMNKHGYFSISLGTDYTMAGIEKARAILLEVNPNVPSTCGNCWVHISQVAGLVETEEELLEVGLPKIGAVEEAIGRQVAELIEDGSTLQIGYGAIPDAVVMQLKDKHDLGIHTEMVGDGILTLVESGVVTNRKKNYHPGKMLATFALGSRRLYRFMDMNPALEMHPVDFTNDPVLAGQNDKLVSINGSIEVDFMGQCNSESIGPLPYSGTGGQADFVRAANRSRGGKSFIVLPSTAKKGSISRIVPFLTPGAVVTTGKNDVNYVVTEHGVAKLRGKSLKQRAEALIGIAHPDFREDLRQSARKLHLL